MLERNVKEHALGAWRRRRRGTVRSTAVQQAAIVQCAVARMHIESTDRHSLLTELHLASSILIVRARAVRPLVSGGQEARRPHVRRDVLHRYERGEELPAVGEDRIAVQHLRRGALGGDDRSALEERCLIASAERVQRLSQRPRQHLVHGALHWCVPRQAHVPSGRRRLTVATAAAARVAR
eukprot:4311409-Prymnesium_polylepis.2